MPPRRGRGRGRGAAGAAARANTSGSATEPESAANGGSANGVDVEMSSDDVVADPVAAEGDQAADSKEEPMETQATESPEKSDTDGLPKGDVVYPYQIKVGPMPETYTNVDLQRHIATTFKVMVPRVFAPRANSPHVYLCFADPADQEGLLKVLGGHVYKRRTLEVEAWNPIENRKRKRESGEVDAEADEKKNKTEEVVVTPELSKAEEILAETLPLLNVAYEDQAEQEGEMASTRKAKEVKPWMTDEIMRALSLVEKHRRQFKKWPDDIARQEMFRHHRAIASKLIKQAKNIYAELTEWNVNPDRFGDLNDENRLSRQDAELMANRLHALLCQKNAALAGWAEKTTETNGGTLLQIEPLKVCANPNGYRNKAKFRVGKNPEGEIVVGFGMNDTDSSILGVEPGDRMVHLPDNMKYAAKKFRDFVAQSGKEPYDKRKKTGTFEYLLVRVAPQGSLMLVIIVSSAGQTQDDMNALKESLKAFFTTGEAQDCNVFSLYLQVLQDAAPIYPRDKLELLAGNPDYEENICGLKFCVSPFSILNVSPASSENIYNSVIELAEPLAPETVIIDACAGSCGIAFTLASRVSKAYAIEPQEDNVRDAQRTKELNNITNVEIIEGKCEDYLELLFTKEAEKPVIVIIDPPRHGVPTKILTQIRAQPNVGKVIYVCSNTKTGIKNFLDLANKTGRDANNGLEYTGLPFLPTKCIPIDCAPYTVNTTVPIVLERVDPSTFPAATKPPPEVVLRDLPTKNKRLGQQRKKQPQQQPRAGVRGVRGGGVQANYRAGGNRSVGNMRHGYGPQPRYGPRGRGFGMGGPPRQPPYMDNIINKYERRIAELEQQDRAFKMGLQAGLVAANRGGGGGGSPMPRSMGDYGTADAFGGYRGGYKDPYGGSPWQQQGGGPGIGGNYGGGSLGYGGGSGGFGGGSGYGAGVGSDNGGGGYGFGHMDFTSDSVGGYGSHATGSGHSLPSSRFVGMGGGGRRGSGKRGGGGGGGGPRGKR